MKNKYLKYSLIQLVMMLESEKMDYKNRNKKENSIYIYTESARKKMEQIAWAIYARTLETKEQRNEKREVSK